MNRRGLLIANPHATSTTPQVRDVITRALDRALELQVVTTTHRGHAASLAGEAAAAGDLDVVITLGGDGTINEVVNGLLESGRDRLPMLAAIPGGSANVMARALGFPNDAVEATGMILESLRGDSHHTIGLANARYLDQSAVAHSQWFTINAGLGLDARVIAAMEAQREDGHAATPLRYIRTAIGEYVRDTERRNPALTLHRPGQAPVEGLALAIVQNTSPWTFFGPMAINPCPRASFDLGLDLFAPHSLGLPSTVRFGLRMLRGSHADGVEGKLTLLHDVPELRFTASPPTELQLDGDGMGLVSDITFRSAPNALRIVG